MPGQKRLLELALKGLEAERRRMPTSRTRFEVAARRAAAKPDHNQRPILGRNRLRVQRGREAD